MPNDLIPVQFHDDTVYLIEHNGEPYVVLKPAVEALGLDWRTQQRKLMANAKRWTVVNLTIVAADGKQREMLCMPVRKWPGYMQTFELRKLPAALRPKMEVWQVESDDALWAYWTQGHAINPRAALAYERMSPEQRAELSRVVRQVISGLHTATRAEQIVYNRLRTQFHLRRIEDLPAEHFDLACLLVGSLKETVQGYREYQYETEEWFVREVLGAGLPWTPGLVRRLRESRGEAVGARPDWQAIAARLDKTGLSSDKQ
jgi:hypothetical protein